MSTEVEERSSRGRKEERSTGEEEEQKSIRRRGA